MFQTLAIAKRELTSLFYSPIAYVVLGLFALGTSMVFFRGFGPGMDASLSGTLAGLVWLMILLLPAISMRMLSEEFRTGTIESLMTSPITDTQVVLGKWLGAMGFFVVLLAPLGALAAVMVYNSSPDWGALETGVLGLLLLGGLYLAIGAFASATTQNQIIAFLLSVFIICFFTIAMLLLPSASILDKPWMRQAAFYLDIIEQFGDFNKGLLGLNGVIFFVSGIALFLFMAIKVLESKRWR